MSPHRTFLALAGVWAGLGLGLPALAQEKAPNFNKLNDALEQRLPDRPRTRSLEAFDSAPSAPAPAPVPSARKREDFYWVKPKKQSNRRSDAGDREETERRFSVAGAGIPLLSLPRAAAALDDPAASGPRARTAQAADQSAPASDAPSTAQTPPQPPAAEATVPVARKNSYVVLIKPEVLRKPDGGAADVIKLLDKYGLEPVRSRRHRSVVAPSGRIVVQQSEETLESMQPRAAPEPTGKAEIDVRKQLEPDIIRKLRKEGIVDDAYVNSTIRNNTLPRPVRTRARSHGKTFGWIWTSPVDSGTTTTAAQPQPAPDNAEPVDDGNWGLKTIRVPAMWTIIKRFRDAAKDSVRPKIAVIDQGFNAHTGLGYAIIDPPSISASHEEPCEAAHGTHVAGIIAAAAKSDVGIDGIVPEATIDAVPFQLDYALEDPGAEEQEWMRRWVLFADVMNDTEDYIVRSMGGERPLRVVNLSLAYNLGGLFTKDPGTVPELVRHIQAQAKDVQRTVRRYEDHVLFVVAAGNDSGQREKPLDAKWASPLAWAGTQSWAAAPPSPNILVVEALDRSGKRADFSNVGGHLSAPGVNVLSTLGPGENVFGVCSGTSQAAPHVAAIATLLFELDPKRKPKEIADVLRKTAFSAPDKGTAPRVDALEAVLRVYPDGARLLADLNRDGKVDEEDLGVFQQQLDEIYDNRLNGTAFSHDLNEDGGVDNNECHWPLADLNGSGYASLDPRDGRVVLGARRTDLEVLQLAWTKGKEDFLRAIASTPLANALPPATIETSSVPQPAGTPVVETIAATACR